MTELVGDLEEKRSRHNSDAERHKRLRDELNEKTKEWAERRDELNSQVRKFIDEANGRRENRDKLNAEVREAKTSRDEWNRKFNDLSDTVAQLRRFFASDLVAHQFNANHQAQPSNIAHTRESLGPIA